METRFTLKDLFYMTWYARIDGQEYGPVTDQQLQQWAMECRILATTEVRQGETGNWRSASQVQGLVLPPPQQIPSQETPASSQVRRVASVNPRSSSRSSGTRKRRKEPGCSTLIFRFWVLILLAVITLAVTLELWGPFAWELLGPSPDKLRLEAISKALFLYQEDVGFYPDAALGLQGLRPYLRRGIPLDSFNREYQYEVGLDANNKQYYKIWGLGPDGKSGTKDDVIFRSKQ